MTLMPSPHLRVATVAGHVVPGHAKVCLVIGAGAGIGVNMATRFSEAGMVVCLCRRSDQNGLNKSIDALQADGWTAHGFIVDAVKPGAVESLVEGIEKDIGEIEVVVYNLGAQIGNRSLDETSLKTFELGWRMGCEGLFRLAERSVHALSEGGCAHVHS